MFPFEGGFLNVTRGQVCDLLSDQHIMLSVFCMHLLLISAHLMMYLFSFN